MATANGTKAKRRLNSARPSKNWSTTMVEIDYISRRGGRIMTRRGSVIEDQYPGDKRRFVIRRSNGKKLKFELPSYTMRQRRDDESKWTRTGRIVEVRDFLVEDKCPHCGHEMAELERIDTQVDISSPPDWSDREEKPMLTRGGSWQARCTDCNATYEPQKKPDEPPWPKPDTNDHGEVLKEVQDYAEHVNDEIFGGEIELDRISWEWNSRNTNTAGRAWSYKIQLTPQYLDKHGWNEFLKVVRHEMIHVWEGHAGDDRSGHSAQFHDWLVPANTRRHCKHF